MTEPGADPRARGGDDATDVATVEVWTGPWRRGDHPQRKVSECTRAELWAAIHAMAAEWYLWGKDGDDVAERVAKRGTERVRALLGMEPEA